MKKNTLIIAFILLNFISCKHNVKDDFSIEVDKAYVFQENEQYYAIVTGSIKNTTKNYLNKVTLSSHIVANKSNGDCVIADFPDFEVLTNGEELKVDESKNFNVKLPFLKFNKNHLKYEYSTAYIKFFVEGQNDLGYKSRDDQSQEYFENWPEYNIIESWKVLTKK